MPGHLQNIRQNRRLLEKILQILIQEPPDSLHKSFNTSTSNTWHLRDLHARTSQLGSHQDLHKIFCSRPVQDMQGPLRGDFTRISTRSSHKDLRKIMQGPLRGRQQDLHKIFSWGPVEDHALPSYRMSFLTLLTWYKVDGGTDVTPRGICQQVKLSK